MMLAVVDLYRTPGKVRHKVVALDAPSTSSTLSARIFLVCGVSAKHR
jgi:hypothetical protein